jgi:hypothetical protein
MIHENHPAQE